MSWERVRHVVLTVGRKTNPVHYYEAVRFEKAIPRLIRRVAKDCTDFLWVLEFHRGGWPHWHLLLEREQEGMIGHGVIANEWRYGHVWESRIMSAKHWDAIVGYHKKKGYLAGESKAHQLALPDFLLSRSRVRKFGAKPSREQNVPRGTSAGRPAGRAKADKYADKFAHCGEGSRINIGGKWTTVAADAAIIRGLAERYLGEPDGPRYYAEEQFSRAVVREANWWTDSDSAE